jgi:hypothetical protein
MWAGNIEVVKEPPPTQFNKSIESSKIMPCVKALLDGRYIDNNDGLNKDSEGTLEVEIEKTDKVYFNLILKSYVGKNEPPLYLRFIKVDRIDIQKVLKYANIGDEIYIEPFGSSGFKCLPSHFVVT